jgi:DNA polymerase-4
MDLCESLYQRRLLVRLIGVKFSHLVSGGHQINLFEDNDKIMSLYQAIDKMRERYGDRKVICAAGMDAKSISRSNPFNGEPPPLLPNRRR